MAHFQMSVSKGPQGEILAYGQYVSGNEPILVERVIIEELGEQGNTVGSFVYHLNRSIDPSPGAYLLASKNPSGTDVKAARASAYFIEIKGIANSPKLNL
jgi:hypothetical protein